MNDDYQYVRIAQHVFNTPLLVLPDVAETIGAYVRSRMEGVRPEANRFAGRPVVDPHTGQYKGYRREGHVGIVSITGELVNRGAWLGASSGLTSYEGVLQQVRAAAGDSDVESILLDINSPGGEAFGMSDTARQIREAAVGKKIVAVINSVGASAAYGLATAANEIVVTESGIAGSIGVVMVHFDRSGQAAKAGVKATVITNTDGLDKARGHPFAALSEDDLAFMRTRADRIMDGFVKLVTDHRPKLTSKAVRAQRANTFIGEDAVRAGLVDRVGTFDQVLDQVADKRHAVAGWRAPASGKPNHTAPHPNRPQGSYVPEGREGGRGAEEARVISILAHGSAVGQGDLARHLALNTTMSPQDAAAAMAAAALDSRPAMPATSAGRPVADQFARGRQIALAALGKAR